MGITEQQVRTKLDPLIGKTIPGSRLRTIASTTLAAAASAGDEAIMVDGKMTHEARDWHVVVGDGTANEEYPHQDPDADMQIVTVKEPVPATPGDPDADPPVEPTAEVPGEYRTVIRLLEPLTNDHAAGEVVVVCSGWAPENYGPDMLVLEPARKGGRRRPVVVPVKAFAQAYADAPTLTVAGLKTANAGKITQARTARTSALVAEGKTAKEAADQAESEIGHGPCCDRVFDEWAQRGVLK